MRLHALPAFALALVLGTFAAAQPQRPNELVWQGEEWRVVRSVRERGNVVACTGFLKGHPAVQLSKDMLVMKVPKELEVASVAFAFDREPLRGPRELTPAEKELGAIVFSGENFDKLVKSRVLRMAVHHKEGTRNVRFDLLGIAGALQAVTACPQKR